MREFAARTAPEEIERVVEKEFREDALLARKVKLYFYHNYTNQRLKEVGIRFGIRESGVSQASRRFSEDMSRDSALRKRIAAIKKVLSL